MCTVFGDPHIITFDSNFYTHQGLGEFWLTTSIDALPSAPDYFAVAAKFSVCSSLFTSTTGDLSSGSSVTVPHSTCARDFAITDGSDRFNFLSRATSTPTIDSYNTQGANVGLTIVGTSNL